MYHSSFGSNANFSSVCDYWQPAHSHSGLRAEVYERRDEIMIQGKNHLAFVTFAIPLVLRDMNSVRNAEGLIFMSTYLPFCLPRLQPKYYI